MNNLNVIFIFISAICLCQAYINRNAVRPQRITSPIRPAKWSQSKICHTSSLLFDAPQPVISSSGSTFSLKERLSAAGRGGLLSYGLLNFIYYISVTTIAWNFSNAGKAEAALITASTLNERISQSMVRLGKVMGIVWAGSQITKPSRMTGALLLSPLADRFLGWFQSKLGIPPSRAFWLLCGGLLSGTMMFYGVVIIGSAVLR